MDITRAKGKPGSILLLTILAALALVFVWRGVAKIMGMQTHAATPVEFAQLKPEQEIKIVIEVNEASESQIRGALLEKQDETHYVRTQNALEARSGKDTKFVMGKQEDIRPGAILHITGKADTHRIVQAAQIVILTGYVQVK